MAQLHLNGDTDPIAAITSGAQAPSKSSTRRDAAGLEAEPMPVDNTTPRTPPAGFAQGRDVKYKIELSFEDGSTEEPEEVFDTEDEASEFGDQWISDYHQGGEVLHMSNPGDYPLNEDEDVDYEVIEVDE